MNQIRFWALSFLFLLALLRAHAVADDYDDDDDYDDEDGRNVDDNESDFCGGVTDASPRELSVSPPAGKFPEADPSAFKPIRFLYLLVGEWTESEQTFLKKTFAHTNDRIGPVVRGPRLKEVRLARELRSDKQSCRKPRCELAEIPSPYALPCMNENGQLIQDESATYAEEVQAYNKDEQYSVVVYVVSPTRKNVTEETCRNVSKKGKPQKPPSAFAVVCQHGERNRPTHGYIIICKDLAMTTDDDLQDTMLHESLHVVVGATLDGREFPSNPLVQQGETNKTLLREEVRGKTWKQFSRTWETSESLRNRTEQTVDVCITSNVLKYLKQEHFKCDEVQGAELAIASVGPDHSHWSMRLFLDDILAPIYSPHRRLSKLTLAYIQDSTWYDVNMSRAEPLVLSRPQAIGCAVARESCFKIRNASVSAGRREIYLGHPYCDQKARVVSPLCSTDNQLRLHCSKEASYNYKCPVRFVAPPIADRGYSDAACSLSQTVPEYLKEKGLRAGNGTMCITFVDTEWALPPPEPPRNKTKRSLHAGCVSYVCDGGRLILQFRRENRPSCNVVVEAAMYGTIIKGPFPAAGDECAKMLSGMKLIAPEIRTMCPIFVHDQDTTPPLTTSYHSKAAISDWNPGTWFRIITVASVAKWLTSF